jgi:two-component system, response regulator PdtaR
VREDIVTELLRAGFRPLEARTGEAAIDICRKERIDVLVTDIQLGGLLTGWDLAEAARGANPAIPVIYASGNPVDQARRVPGSRFLNKPCLTVDIVAACKGT